MFRGVREKILASSAAGKQYCQPLCARVCMCIHVYVCVCVCEIS